MNPVQKEISPKRVPVSPETHRRMKIHAARVGRPLQDVVEEILVRELDQAEERAA